MKPFTTSAVAYEKELGRDLLASVSRSFYLSLRVLPAALRGPMSLAYLLARATDTVADTSGETALRLHALDHLLACIAGEGDAGVLAVICRDLQSRTPLASERLLLEKVPRCMEWLSVTDSETQGEIRWLLERIGRGQRMDLVRFEKCLFGVETAADLLEYTYLVAGAVGEFWTRMAWRIFPRYSNAPQEVMLEEGAAMGRGLQLVNILRDLPTDLRNGRCYLPADELKGIDGDALQANPALAGEVFTRWMQTARTGLAAGCRYAAMVRPLRVRFACLVPVLAGEKTLNLVQKGFPQSGLKISRPQMRACLFASVCRSLLPAHFGENPIASSASVGKDGSLNS